MKTLTKEQENILKKYSPELLNFMKDSYRRFIINDRYDCLWSGLEYESHGRKVVKDGYYEWETKPHKRSLNWMSFTQKGIDTFRELLPIFDILFEGNTDIAFCSYFTGHNVVLTSYRAGMNDYSIRYMK